MVGTWGNLPELEKIVADPGKTALLITHSSLVRADSSESTSYTWRS